jgi:hypothetical protein
LWLNSWPARSFFLTCRSWSQPLLSTTQHDSIHWFGGPHIPPADSSYIKTAWIESLHLFLLNLSSFSVWSPELLLRGTVLYLGSAQTTTSTPGIHSSKLILRNFVQFGTGCDPWPKIPIRHFGNQWSLAWHFQKFGIQDENFRKFSLFCTSEGDLALMSRILHSALGTVTHDRDQNSSRHRGCVTRDHRIEWNCAVCLNCHCALNAECRASCVLSAAFLPLIDFNLSQPLQPTPSCFQSLCPATLSCRLSFQSRLWFFSRVSAVHSGWRKFMNQIHTFISWIPLPFLTPRWIKHKTKMFSSSHPGLPALAIASFSSSRAPSYGYSWLARRE